MAKGKVISYSLSVNNCPLHHGVINGHRALGVTDKCFKVVWSRVLFLNWKRNTRYANLLFVLGDFQNRKWAPNWNWALKPATEKRPSGLLILGAARPHHHSTLVTRTDWRHHISLSGDDVEMREGKGRMEEMLSLSLGSLIHGFVIWYSLYLNLTQFLLLNSILPLLISQNIKSDILALAISF